MLVQKGTQRIEIIVRKDSNGETGAKETDAEEVGGGNGKNAKVGTDGMTAAERRKHRIIKTNTTHAIATAKQIADLTLEYYHSGIGLRHGDQALQDQVQRKTEIVKDVSGFASSVAMGAVYGSWGGPIGTVLGAVFGAATTAASIGVKYASRQREFNFKVFKENNAIEYKKARAGINLTTGRLR